jgi:hypothetical protein
MMWTIDSSVGRHASNNSVADISYIQWYYQLASTYAETPPERREIYSKVKVTGQCTGKDTDPLVQAILAHQKGLSHPVVDGKVSTLPGASGDVRLGANQDAFFVLRIGARIAHMYPDAWPRLDKMPKCPPAVAEAVRAALPKLGE